MGGLQAAWPRVHGTCARFVLALAFATCASASHAQLITWTGTGANTNWTTGQNWSTGLQPVNSGTLVFSGTSRTSSFNDITSGTFGGLNFTNTGATGLTSSFTLSGNAFTLAGGGSIVTTATTAGSALTDTLATNIVLGTNATITTNAGHNLTISGTISGSGFGLTKTGANTLTLSGSNTFDGPVSLQVGTIQVNSINNAGVAGSLGTTGTITINGGTSLEYTGAAASTDRSFIIDPGSSSFGAAFVYGGTAGGGLTFTSGTFNVPTAASRAGNISLRGAASGTSTIQGVIQDNVGFAMNLTKITEGHTWRLSGANTFSGGVVVQGNTLQIDSWSALGTGTSAVMIGHNGFSAQLEYLGASGTTSRQIQIGNGTLAAHSPVVTLLSNGSGPVVFTSGTFNFAQTNAINTNARRLELSGANTGVNEIQGTIVNNAANAVTTGSGAVALLKTGAGRWVLSGSNTYSGTTTVGAGTLQIGNNGTTGSLPTSSVITGSAGATLAFNRTDTITSGTDFNTTIGGAINVRQIGSGTLVFNAAQSYTGTTTVDAGTLRITGGGNTANGALASPSVVVNSGATLRLSQKDALGYTAGRAALTIVGGTVTNDSGVRSTLANAVTMTGGVMTSAGAGDADGNYTLTGTGGIAATSDAAGNAATISAQKLSLQVSGSFSTLNVTRGVASPASDLAISAVLANFGSGTAGIRKTGNGILTLSAANTYTGTTTIDGGTLRITYGGNVANGALASPSVVINSGATLQLSAQRAIGFTAGRAAITIAGGTVTTDAGLRTAFVNNVTMTGGVLTSAGAGDSNGNYNFYDAGVVATSDAVGNAATISAEKLSLQFSSGSGTATFNVTRGSATPASDLAISAIIANFGSGTAGIRKTGNGILTLSATNTYSGGTWIDAGTLKIGTAGAFGSGAVTLASGATLDLSGLTVANSITNNGGTILGGLGFTGTTTVTSGTSMLTNIGGTVDIDAAAVADLAGTIDAEVNVKNGGRGRALGQIKNKVTVNGGAHFDILNDASVENAAAFANNGQIHIDRTGNLTLGNAISGTGGLLKSGNSRVKLTANNTFTGITQVDAGALVVNGALAGDVVIGSGATLGGSGILGDTLSGAGTISVGNSPGIGTADSVDPSLGTDWVFEVTGTAPTWGSPTGSINDVLHLTGTASFLSNLASGNVVDVLFDLTSGGPVAEGSYLGGFFVDNMTVSELETALAGGQFRYWVVGEFGETGDRQTFPIGTDGALVTYSLLSVFDSSLTASYSVKQETVNFGSGNVTGAATQFVIVPEPGTVIFATVGIAMAGWSLRRRRRVAQILCMEARVIAAVPRQPGA